MSAPSTVPELLAPAGDWDCARAAVENGADAIYFGLDAGFNARARAANFAVADLPELMTYLHRRGVRGYVTLNTLVFPNELEEVEQLVRRMAAAQVDAVLVQDLGAARLIREVCPDLELHASTQMTLTSAECIAVASHLGIKRVVLPRELSIEEIAAVHRQTSIPLEAFVHGALCVAYSGQCLTSESLGGRSANRGQCAQACRLPYDLLCDGREVDLGPVRYLLSPQDLAAYTLTPELAAAGVCAFKIEGRLKTPEYVANITRHYRAAIDAIVERRPVELTREQQREMELSFSRGFSPGWLQGCDHKQLVPGLSSAKRGILLGEVVRVRGRRVMVALKAPVAKGDGVVFAGNREQGEEQGGRIFQVYLDGEPQDSCGEDQVAELAFDRQAIRLDDLSPGQQIWKTDDPRLTSRLRQTFRGPDPLRRVEVDLQVRAAVGEPLRVMARTSTGVACELASTASLQAANKHPLRADLLRAQLGRLGGTVYQLRSLQAQIEGEPMAPLSVLGKLRHELIRRLDAATASRPLRVAAEPVLPRLRAGIKSMPESGDVLPTLHVLSRTLEQLRETIAAGVMDHYVDFQDLREYREAVRLAHEAGARIVLATPRVHKPGETGIFRSLLRHGADGILVRNLAGVAFFKAEAMPLVADFSLNVANELTAQFLMQQGVCRITASYDLNRNQLLDLVDAIPAAWLEVVIHQQMPMFHMEHCVFCAVLSPGTNKTNCGRPCDLHQVKLRDRIGTEHPLTADVGCRNTLFNATPQSAAEVVPSLLRRSLRHFRVELVQNTPREVREIVQLYRELLAGQISGREVWRRLRATNRVGVTRGTLEARRDPLAVL